MKLLDTLYSITPANATSAHTFNIRLNPDCEIYKAHFPDFPVTPGVCLIGICCELAEIATGLSWALNTIVNAKFLIIVDPRRDAHLTVNFKKIELADTTMKVSVDITTPDLTTTFCRLSLIFDKK